MNKWQKLWDAVKGMRKSRWTKITLYDPKQDKYCIMGYAFKKAGFSNEEIASYSYGLPMAEEAYGLDGFELGAIAGINDLSGLEAAKKYIKEKAYGISA